MPYKYFFRLSLNGRFRSGSLTWDPRTGNLVVFFASLLEKIKELSKSPHRQATSNPLRILLADDDEDDRQLFEEAIMEIDPVISLETVGTGIELISTMEERDRPQIIFLDLNMPGKNGKECLAEIRQHKEWRHIPVIIYSTSSNQKDIIDTYNAGANLYILKPSSFRDLVGIIKKSFSFDLEQSPKPGKNDFVLTKE